MRVLVLGSTGMLGQSLMKFFAQKQIEAHGVARANATFELDIVNDWPRVQEIITKHRYDVVINTVALINLLQCEQFPERAYSVNTYVAGKVSELCAQFGIYFVHISTDHFYTNDGEKLHTEEAPITLLNEYAKTKFLAEQLVALNSNALIVRTNIVGYRSGTTPTFVEWIINTMEKNEKISGFTNMYTSSIDVTSFCYILYELLCVKHKGIINVGAEGVLSKFEFIHRLLHKFNKSELVEKCEMPMNGVKRANSLGLSNEQLKQLCLPVSIPTVNEVIHNLYEQYIGKAR